MKVGLAKLKLKRSMYKSFLQMFKAHLHSKRKEKTKQSDCGEQVRSLGENRSNLTGAAHWARGAPHSLAAVHWATFYSVKKHGRDAYTGRSALGWMHDALTQRARKLLEHPPITRICLDTSR